MVNPEKRVIAKRLIVLQCLAANFGPVDCGFGCKHDACSGDKERKNRTEDGHAAHFNRRASRQDSCSLWYHHASGSWRFRSSKCVHDGEPVVDA